MSWMTFKSPEPVVAFPAPADGITEDETLLALDQGGMAFVALPESREGPGKGAREEREEWWWLRGQRSRHHRT